MCIGIIFRLVHVKDSSVQILKIETWTILSYHNLNVQTTRGHMIESTWSLDNGRVYNQHYFLMIVIMHTVYTIQLKLQLALAAIAKEVLEIYNFFQSMVSIVNVITSSS